MRGSFCANKKAIAEFVRIAWLWSMENKHIVYRLRVILKDILKLKCNQHGEYKSHYIYIKKYYV